MTAGPLVEKNGNRFEVRCPPDIGSIREDATKVRQVLLNLLSNAAKFTENGVVTLEVRREVGVAGNWVFLTVRDTGIGMTPEQTGRLFEAFEPGRRGHDEEVRRHGPGPGDHAEALPAHGRRHRRRERSPARGTTFTVRLPGEIENFDGDATSVRVSTLHGRPHPASGACRRAPADAAPARHRRGPGRPRPDEARLRERGLPGRHRAGAPTASALARESRPDADHARRPAARTRTVGRCCRPCGPTRRSRRTPVVVRHDRGRPGPGRLSLGATEYLVKPIDHERLLSVLERATAPERRLTGRIA